MPRRCPKFITEYLIPSLNSKRFGRHLKWLDRENSLFQLSWRHKGETHWSEGEAQVFVEWDKIKGHYQPNKKEYFTRSKQRFRALLYKLSKSGQLTEIESDTKNKVYCITCMENPRRRRQSSNADSGIFSTDDMSFNDNEMLSHANDDEMNEFSFVNSSIDNLDDHNYSKCLVDSPDLEGTRFDHQNDVTLSSSASECVDTSKKVLVEQNYMYFHNDSNNFLSKEKNAPTDLSWVVYDEDLQSETKNAVLKGNNGFLHVLDHCNTPNENITHVESTETLSNSNVDINVQLEKMISDLEIDDSSNTINFWNRVMSWS